MTMIRRSTINLGIMPSTVLVLLINCLLFQPAQARSLQSKSGSSKASEKLTPAQVLARGKFFYNNGDTSEDGPNQFRQLIKQYPKSVEAEEAQFYLGSFYHRKYYIAREKWRNSYAASLHKAANEYRQYVVTYSKAKSAKWLTDSRFNLSLVYMALDNIGLALDELNTIALFDSAKDASVYIYQVIWSPSAGDVLDFDFNARALAEYTRGVAQARPSSWQLDQTVAYIKKWCQNQKREKSSAKY